MKGEVSICLSKRLSPAKGQPCKRAAMFLKHIWPSKVGRHLSWQQRLHGCLGKKGWAAGRAAGNEDMACVMRVATQQHVSETFLHACSLFLLKHSTAWHFVAIFQLLQALCQKESLEKGKALEKGQALQKGITKMSAQDGGDEQPDWSADGDTDVKEPKQEEVKKKSPPREAQPNEKSNPPKQSPSPARMNPPARKNPPEEKPVKGGWSRSSWQPKDSWEDGWDDSYWGHGQKSWPRWEDDQWSSHGRKGWDDDDWGNHPKKGESQTSGSSKERKKLEQLRQQCPQTDDEVLKLAAMGGSRFKRLQKRQEEREEKREQAEKMKNLESQVSQLQECNLQWMQYHQQQQYQQAAWQAASAWPTQAYVPMAAGPMQGPTLFSTHAVLLFWHHVIPNVYPISAATLPS